MSSFPTGSGARAVAVVLGLGLGIVTALAAYTFVYARGSAYLTDDPLACANCHVMQGHLDAWSRSSHHAVAVCNDCHTPPDLAGTIVTKIRNGYHHSVAFTTGRFHEPIRITAGNLDVTERACRGCHGEIVSMIDLHGPVKGAGSLSCVRCHAGVGHP